MIPKIQIITLGNSFDLFDFGKLKKWNSKFFKIEGHSRIEHLPNPKKQDGYLDIIYTKEEISKILNQAGEYEFVFAIMKYNFDDNFYLHRIGKNNVCLSLSNIPSILLNKHISIENFILKNIYEIIVAHTILSDISSDEVYNYVHQDTRGCLFDLNGDKHDIVFNTEQPIVCDECSGKIKTKNLPNNYLNELLSELKKIKKPFFTKAELFIKKYPLISLILSFFTGICINLISSAIWNLFITKSNG